ncbi:MAG TPA: alpha/beta hydrolase [Thermoleophilaceae bacterium]|jgi:pimeloyl-ACP methyl ester carboxylesterase
MTQAIETPGVDAEMVDVAGAQVAVRRRGSGRPLLYLHGAGFTGRWLRIHEALSAGADVIAPEHPGFGASPDREEIEGFDDLVLHYDDLRARFGLEEPFDLVGYSLGGWIAADYAVTYPEKLRSLTLITPAGLEPPIVDFFAMEPEQVFATLFNDFTNVGEVMVDPNDIDVAVHMYEEASTVAKLAWNPRYDRKLARRLRRVSCPTLIVGAENDRLLAGEQSDRYAELIPGAKLVRIPGTGHAIPIEQPEATAQAILEFNGGLA